MKTSLLIKMVVVLPLLVFADYLIMTVLGCTTCLLGFGDDFYCGPFCFVGKLILGLSVIFFLFLIFQDLKTIYKTRKNGSST